MGLYAHVILRIFHFAAWQADINVSYGTKNEYCPQKWMNEWISISMCFKEYYWRVLN